MDVVNLIFSGDFLFSLINRAIGATDAWAVEYEQEWLISIDSTPLVTFAFHVAVFYIWSVMLTRVLETLTGAADGWISWRVVMNRKVDPRAMFAWLSTKRVVTINVELDATTRRHRKIRSVTWVEDERGRWKGPPPVIELTYDDTNGFLLEVAMQLHASRSELSQEELLNLFQDDLITNRIMAKSDRLILPEFQIDTDAEDE
mmetsp:Transcript_4409/g.13033  ORF Transcript_4409/g.13033 Transcript_4409/m.13033 type:complete len:202 (-) Transcript_4409:197-802(-)